MSFERRVNRNKLKRHQKNNKINKAWRVYQINKFGIKKWCKLYNSSVKIKNSANKKTIKTAYIV